jgi:uncharacterized membrane protein YdjX (TVP38/TMEM64 family)
VAIWVLTRNRPTSPRRGTTVLVMGAASLLLVAVHREERREHVRTHGATAGLALLGVFTTGTVLAMLPGLLDATAAVA